MKTTEFAKRFSADAGIVNLMEDLGEAINVNPDLLFMGGGNPAHIPEFEQRVTDHLRRIVDNPAALHKLIGAYQSPRGSEEFIAELIKFFRQQCGWKINKNNIAISNGSQSAFFILINMLVGATDSENRRVCYPVMPEYLGYSDQGLIKDCSVSIRPRVDLLDDGFFKYRVNQAGLEQAENISAYCISRPTNPSGNIISENELDCIAGLAKKNDAYLIVDCAYGNPFPGMVYDPVVPLWHDNSIYVLSLSKLGLPGVRTGIVVGPEEVINKFVKINTVISLANGNLGPVLATSFLKAGEMSDICGRILLPFYRAKRDLAVAEVQKQLHGIPCRIHNPEGAFFLWLWLENLPVTSMELYERLKKKNVLIMPGEHFFFGLGEEWEHTHQCVRLTYCQDNDVLIKAIRLLGEELRIIYKEG